MPDSISAPVCCDKSGCTITASCVLAINVPAKGVPIAEHDPLQMILSLPYCDEHIKVCDATEFLEASGGIMKQHFRDRIPGGRELDFGRAFCSAIRFDSAEWKELGLLPPVWVD